jgi:hypothetical protein
VVITVFDFVVAVVVTFVVVTGAAEDVVVTMGTGTVVSDETAADPVVVAAPETGRIRPPTRTARMRAVTIRRTPRIFERCIHTIGGINS